MEFSSSSSKMGSRSRFQTSGLSKATPGRSSGLTSFTQFASLEIWSRLKVLMVRRDAPGKEDRSCLLKLTTPQSQATTHTTQTISDSGNLAHKASSTSTASIKATTSEPSVRDRVLSTSHLSFTRMTQQRAARNSDLSSNTFSQVLPFVTSSNDSSRLTPTTWE